jgi:hypothetical protein
MKGCSPLHAPRRRVLQLEEHPRSVRSRITQSANLDRCREMKCSGMTGSAVGKQEGDEYYTRGEDRKTVDG